MKRKLILLCWLNLALVACFSAPAVGGAQPDASVEADASFGADAGDWDAGEALDAGEWIDAGPQPLEGDAPFSRVLRGSAHFSNNGEWVPFDATIEVAVQVYFPEGVHPKAPFVIARVSPSARYFGELKVLSGQLDDQSLATGLKLHLGYQGICSEDIADATLDPLTGEFRGAMTIYDYCSYDAIGRALTREIVLSNTGAEAPTGELRGASQPVLPRDPSVSWSATVPLNVTSPYVLTTRVGQQEYTTGFVVRDTSVSWSLSGAVPPNQSLLLTGTGLKDVIGREVLVHATASTVSAPKPITDLSLATDPPTGSLAGDVTWYQSPRELRVSSGRWDRSPASALMNLGSSPGLSTLSVRVFQETCGTASMAYARASLLSTTGALTDVPVACSRDAAPAKVLLPGSGTVWLLVDRVLPSAIDGSQVVVRDLAFEP